MIFYYKTVLEMIFYNKNTFEIVFTIKYSGNDFIIKMHWKLKNNLNILKVCDFYNFCIDLTRSPAFSSLFLLISGHLKLFHFFSWISNYFRLFARNFGIIYNCDIRTNTTIMLIFHSSLVMYPVMK